MEGPIPPKSKPLSYDALKSVIKSMSVEKRQELHDYLPSLRATNALLPYTIEGVRICENEIQINRKVWTFVKNPEQSNSGDDDSNQTTISIQDFDSGKTSPDITVKKSPDEALEKCFNVYVKNGSTIQDLNLSGVPKFLCERDESDGFKLNISTLRTNGVLVDVFDYFIRFVNLDKLEKISLLIHNRYIYQSGQFEMLEKPSIINCKNLDLFTMVPETPPINYITGLRNQTLILRHSYFSVNDLRMLIENWKTSNRPIGTSFYLYSYKNDTNKTFNSLELQDTFPVEIQCDLTDKPGIGMKMDDDRNLVLYHGQHLINGMYRPALKMEVIASGSLKKIGDSEPHVSG